MDNIKIKSKLVLNVFENTIQFNINANEHTTV